jgi:hypothetical protein
MSVAGDISDDHIDLCDVECVLPVLIQYEVRVNSGQILVYMPKYLKLKPNSLSMD